MKVMKNITRWCFSGQGRALLLGWQKEVISLLVSMVLSILSDWEEVMLYGVDYCCAQVECENGGKAQSIVSWSQLPIALYSMVIFQGYSWFPGAKGKTQAQCGWLDVISELMPGDRNTCLFRNADGHQQNLAHYHIPIDRRWEHLHPLAMPAFFMSQNPFMEFESMLEVLY